MRISAQYISVVIAVVFMAAGTLCAASEHAHLHCFMEDHLWQLIIFAGICIAGFGALFVLLFRFRSQITANAASIAKKRDDQVRELEQYRHRYNELTETLRDGYIEVDLRGTIIELNQTVARIFNASRESLLGRHYSSLLTVTENTDFIEKYRSVFLTGKPESINDLAITGKDNQQRSVTINVSLITDENGSPNGFRSFVKDNTELVQAQSNQSMLREQLRRSQQIEAIGTLAGGIAHDFNNLLMAIQGNTSILLFKMNKEDPLYSKLTNIESCIHSGAELTKQLLGFAKGKKTTVMSLDIIDLVKETAITFKRTRKAIQLHEAYPTVTLNSDADSGQIKQVFLNILINTWQASPEKKSINIMAERVDISPDKARNMGLKPGGFNTILISNTGSGPQSTVDQPTAQDTRTGINAGIGITSSSEVVKSYNGLITCHRSGADEVAYTVFLPESKRQPQTHRSPATVMENGTGTVLFVDDEEMIIEVGKPMLEELGYDVLVARGGEEAVKVYEVYKGKIDLVILDMVMPSVDGADVYQMLKRIDPEVKTLISSGYSLDEKADELLNDGCNGFIQKPFNLKRLSRQIKDALG